MLQEEQVRLIKEITARMDRGENVDAGGIRKNPASVYASPDLLAREWDVFFRNHPQVIGMTGDLPGPGTFIACEDFGVPVLATRDDQGRFRAFVNVCRHRNVVVEEEAKGKRRRFMCPFHGWTYSNEGELVSVPKENHFGKVDKSCHGLVPLPAVERYGLLWVHPQPEGELDVDTLLGGLSPEFDAWNWDQLVRFGEDTYDMRLNWKLAMDTFGETYHFPTLHRNTLAADFHGNIQAYDTFGRNHRMTLVMKSIDQMRHEPEEKWDIRQCALPAYYLFPAVQVLAVPFGVVLVRAYPDPKDPAHHVSRITFYARPDALETYPEVVKIAVRNFVDVIRDEDYMAAARSQRGADSGMIEYSIFGRNEPALHHYHNTYREALGMELLPLLPEAG